MLSAVILSERGYPAVPLVGQLVDQRFVRPGPLVLGTGRFNGRTAQPLGPAPAPGCDEPTSRCQTIPSIWTLGEDQPVIPGVPFIR